MQINLLCGSSRVNNQQQPPIYYLKLLQPTAFDITIEPVVMFNHLYNGHYDHC